MQALLDISTAGARSEDEVVVSFIVFEGTIRLFEGKLVLWRGGDRDREADVECLDQALFVKPNSARARHSGKRMSRI